MTRPRQSQAILVTSLIGTIYQQLRTYQRVLFDTRSWPLVKVLQTETFDQIESSDIVNVTNASSAG